MAVGYQSVVLCQKSEKSVTFGLQAARRQGNIREESGGNRSCCQQPVVMDQLADATADLGSGEREERKKKRREKPGVESKRESHFLPDQFFRS
jgi:hypothetical protein